MPRMDWNRGNKAQKKKELYANGNHHARVRRGKYLIITYPDCQFGYYDSERTASGDRVKIDPFERMDWAELEYLVERDENFSKL